MATMPKYNVSEEADSVNRRLQAFNAGNDVKFMVGLNVQVDAKAGTWSLRNAAKSKDNNRPFYEGTLTTFIDEPLVEARKSELESILHDAGALSPDQPDRTARSFGIYNGGKRVPARDSDGRPITYTNEAGESVYRTTVTSGVSAFTHKPLDANGRPIDGAEPLAVSLIDSLKTSGAPMVFDDAMIAESRRIEQAQRERAEAEGKELPAEDPKAVKLENTRLYFVVKGKTQADPNNPRQVLSPTGWEIDTEATAKLREMLLDENGQRKWQTVPTRDGGTRDVPVNLRDIVRDMTIENSVGHDFYKQLSSTLRVENHAKQATKLSEKDLAQFNIQPAPVVTQSEVQNEAAVENPAFNGPEM